MTDLIKASKIAFCSEFSFYLKAHNFHWNVEGPNFQQYHALFKTIYEEVQLSIDLFAENIRKLDSYAPGSFTQFNALSTIQDITDVPEATVMIAILAQDSVKMAELCGMVFRIAEDTGEYGYSDFLAGRQDAYRKHAWMLNATLKS